MYESAPRPTHGVGTITTLGNESRKRLERKNYRTGGARDGVMRTRLETVNVKSSTATWAVGARTGSGAEAWALTVTDPLWLATRQCILWSVVARSDEEEWSPCSACDGVRY